MLDGAIYREMALRLSTPLSARQHNGHMLHPRTAHRFALYLLAIILPGLGSDLRAQPSTHQTQPLQLSLYEAVATALTNSPEIEVLRLNPERAREDVKEERGRFDPVLVAEGYKQRQVEPSGSSILGSEVTTSGAGGSVGLEQLLPWGTKLSMDWDSSRDRDDSLVSSLDPAYGSTLQLSLAQPLLQGAFDGRPWMFVRVRQASYRAALDDYDTNLVGQLREIIRRYWGQQLARLEVHTAEKSLERTIKFKDEIEGRVRVGVLSPLAGSDASAQVALRKEDLIRTKNALLVASNRLRQSLGIDLTLHSATELVLTDEPTYVDVKPDVEESIEKALSVRPDIMAQRNRIRAAELTARIAENELLPEINVIGSAGVEGLSGDPKAGFSGQVDDTFEGDFNDAIDELESGDYYNYRAGIVFRQPLGDTSSRARANRARIELAQQRARLSALMQEAIVEVRNAIGDIESGKQRILAAEEAKRFAEESVRNGEERFAVGLATIREVLDAQEDLAEAESTLARSLVDYRVSIDDLYSSRGELLARYGIRVIRDSTK